LPIECNHDIQTKLAKVSLPYDAICFDSCRETVNGRRPTANALPPVFANAHPAMVAFVSGWTRSIMKPKARSSLRRRFQKRAIACLSRKMTAKDGHVTI
jgi:hypothetical protein